MPTDGWGESDRYSLCFKLTGIPFVRIICFQLVHSHLHPIYLREVITGLCPKFHVHLIINMHVINGTTVHHTYDYKECNQCSYSHRGNVLHCALICNPQCPLLLSPTSWVSPSMRMIYGLPSIKYEIEKSELSMSHGPLTRYVILWVAHAPGIPETNSPPPLVSDPDMHHSTCMTHVPWCMPESLTSSFVWSRLNSVAKKTFPASPAQALPTVLRIYVSGKRSMGDANLHCPWYMLRQLKFNKSCHYGDHWWDCYPDTLYLSQSHCNTLEDRAHANFIYKHRTRYSNALKPVEV